MGSDVVPTTSGEVIGMIDIYGDDWPPRPSNVRPLTPKERAVTYGTFTAVPDPHTPGYVKITNASNFKIAAIDVPQLVVHRVKGVNKTGRIWVNTRMVDMTLGLFAAWDAAGLMPLIKTFDGGFVPRYVRGSTTALSNHAWGTAFDINAQWNGLGKVPPRVGEPGSVRQLVEIAVKNGFYWGSWFKDRPDGMHFEAASTV